MNTKSGPDNLKLYLYNATGTLSKYESSDENKFERIFPSSKKYMDIFDEIIKGSVKDPTFPIKSDVLFAMHTNESCGKGTDRAPPRLSELFFSKFVTYYQQFKKRKSRVKISFVTIYSDEENYAANRIVDRINNGRVLKSIVDAEVIKCDSVGLTLATLSDGSIIEENESLSANSKSSQDKARTTNIFTIMLKDNHALNFIHTHSWSIGNSVWEKDHLWKKTALNLLGLDENNVYVEKNLKYAFIIPGNDNGILAKAEQCSVYYSKRFGNKDNKLEQDADDLELHLENIRKDLNLMSSFLLNNRCVYSAIE